MDEKKRGLDDLLSDMGIGEEEAAPSPVITEEPAVPLVAKAQSPSQGPKETLETFMVGLLLRLDPAYSIDVRQEGELLRAEVLGGDLGRFIGKEGRTLKSAEFLANVYMAKQFGGEYRVVLDAAGYRKRQEERIKRIAMDAALQVEVSGQQVELPPMRSGERRIIHLLLKQHPKVTTTSVGEGEERHVIVIPRDADTPVEAELEESHDQ